MSLHTPAYLLFLLVFTPIYWAIPSLRWRKLLLLGTSLGFYALFDWRFLVLLFGVVLVVYWAGWKIHQGPHRRIYTFFGVVSILIILAIFKYANFFIGNLGNVADSIQLILPIGISFYTFQAISYLLEIYRGKLSPSANFIDFALYLSFFPKLIAGPLIRPKQFLDQVGRLPMKPDGGCIRSGVLRILLGLFKKVLIADSLASMADAAFRAASLTNGGDFPTPLYIQGFYLYAIQIYADFSGYTDIALGSAKLLGIQLPENFQQPYLSTSLTTFWNRWHISLTQWFRENLYFPLVRAGLIKTGRKWPRVVQVGSNMLTMTLIGLWHGSNWTYVAWGAYHGLLLSLESLTGWRPKTAWQRSIGQFATFHLVAIGWILFRSPSFNAAGKFIGGLFSGDQMQWTRFYLWPVILPAILFLIIDWFQSGSVPHEERLLKRYRPVIIITAGFSLLALALLSLARGDMTQPFIYGQF